MSNYMQPNGTSLYGNYRTRTFSNIFEDAETFMSEFNDSIFGTSLVADNNFEDRKELIFYLLYARYGNSNIASSDENRFKYQLFSIMFQYGPTWAKELNVQQEIRNKDLEEFIQGATNIVNIAQNPSTAPTTQSLEELPYINNQNVNKTKRSMADAYALMLSLLKEDVTETFIRRFEKLFLTIVAPERPLWYVTYPEEE